MAGRIEGFDPVEWLIDFDEDLSTGYVKKPHIDTQNLDAIHGSRNATNSFQNYYFRGVFGEFIETEPLNDSSNYQGKTQIIILGASYSRNKGYVDNKLWTGDNASTNIGLDNDTLRGHKPEIDDIISFCGGEFKITKIETNSVEQAHANIEDGDIVAWFCECTYHPGVHPTITNIKRFNPMKFNPMRFN